MEAVGQPHAAPTMPIPPTAYEELGGSSLESINQPSHRPPPVCRGTRTGVQTCGLAEVQCSVAELEVHLPASVGKQTAVERQANLAKVVEGAREGVFWTEMLSFTWRRTRKSER